MNDRIPVPAHVYGDDPAAAEYKTAADVAPNGFGSRHLGPRSHSQAGLLCMDAPGTLMHCKEYGIALKERPAGNAFAADG